MKTHRSRLGLSIIAGGLSFVGAANAVDLIVNGSFENPNGGEWKYYGTYNYATPYFTGAQIPASENAGSVWSWNHASANGAYSNFVTPTNLTDFLQYDLQYADSQTVSLTNAITGPAIDSGLGRYTFSSWLASYGTPSQNPEQPFLLLRFSDASAAQVGSDVIFDRTSNVNAVMYADGTTTIPDDLSGDHNFIKYAASGTVPAGARTATVYITRSPNAGLSGRPDTYVDLVKLDVININDTTSLDTASPANGSTNNSPASTVLVQLRDIATQVDAGSVRLAFDGSAVSGSVQKAGAVTSIQYQPPLLAPRSVHNYSVVWSDNGTPVTTRSNYFTFSVVPYVNVNLGPPIALETFDELAEGTLPPGWSVQNFTDPDTVPGSDLNNFHSDSYLDWVVISRSTLSNLFAVTPGGADFVGTLNVAPNQVINGALVTNLVSGNFAFAVADRGSSGTQKQIQYLFTGDYNLSGKNNVYLSFHNIYVQNQDSLGSVEYSINGGATWLPALYMLDGPDILRDAQGNVDASNTFAFVHSDVPNIELSSVRDGFYGQYIGVNSNQWTTLAPFLSARLDDDQTDSKRVEIVRLPQADNQTAVRLRFAQVGTYSWYFGLDDLGFYSISTASPPDFAGSPAPTAQTVAAGNSASLSVPDALGLGPMTYQWRLNGTNLPGKTSQSLVLPVVRLSDAGIYDVVVSSPFGSATSAPPAAVLNVINPPVFVTGQWDFNGNLAATLGRALEYFDATVQADTTFGTTTSYGLPDINGVPTSVMHFVPSGSPWGGYKTFHGAAPNGGGNYVNQYTLVYDLYYPVGGNWRSLWQTGLANDNDGDVFINTANGLGISSIYDGFISEGTWHRVAFAFDLTGPGQAPVLTKFVDGVKVGNQTTGLSAKDGRFALDAAALLFADNDGDQAETYVSSVQFSNGRRPDAYLEALGGPNARKIPGAITATTQGGQIIITWTGGVPLETADSAGGPWRIVDGATSPYPIASPSGAKYFRPKVY